MIKRRFENNNFNISAIPINRLIVGFFLGIFVTLIAYSFLNIFKEVFRVIESGMKYNNGPLVLDEQVRFRYNFLCAAFSVIIGNSTFVLFCLSRPQKVFNRYSTKTKRIINEQVFVNFNFSFWLAKVSFYSGVSIMFFLDIGVIESYYYVFLLVLLVLYLECWKTLSQVIRKNKFKVLGGHFILLIGISFLLSKWNVIDFYRIDQALMRTNPVIQLPISEYMEGKEYQYYGEDVIKLSVDDSIPRVILNRRVVSFDSLYELLNRTDKLWNPRRTLSIYAGKDVKMKTIKDVEEIFFLSNYFYVKYMKSDSLQSNYFSQNGILIRIPVLNLTRRTNGIPPPLTPPFFNEEKYIFTSVVISDSYSVGDEKSLNKKELIKAFENRIDSSTVFQYKYSENISYQKYIDVLSAHKQAIFNLKEKEGLFLKENHCHDNYVSDDQFNTCYEEFRKERERLRNKYPFLIKEEITD